MKKISTKTKIILAVIILVIGLSVFGHGTTVMKAVQEAAHNFLMMLQEFASKDIVGIA
jgi:uncharacterized protein YpmB